MTVAIPPDDVGGLAHNGDCPPLPPFAFNLHLDAPIRPGYVGAVESYHLHPTQAPEEQEDECPLPIIPAGVQHSGLLVIGD